MRADIDMSPPRSYGDIEQMAQTGANVAGLLASELNGYIDHTSRLLMAGLQPRMTEPVAESMTDELESALHKVATLAEQMQTAWERAAAVVVRQRETARQAKFAAPAAGRSGGFMGITASRY
jgi:hypothetical protein